MKGLQHTLLSTVHRSNPKQPWRTRWKLQKRRTKASMLLVFKKNKVTEPILWNSQLLTDLRLLWYNKAFPHTLRLCNIQLNCNTFTLLCHCYRQCNTWMWSWWKKSHCEAQCVAPAVTIMAVLDSASFPANSKMQRAKQRGGAWWEELRLSEWSLVARCAHLA